MHSCKVFRNVLLVCEAFISAGLDDISAGLSNAMRISAFACVWARPEGVAVRRAPEPGPTQGDRVEPLDLSLRPFAALPQGGGVRCPRLPSNGSRIMNPSSSC
jgi:hypothetical protein